MNIIMLHVFWEAAKRRGLAALFRHDHCRVVEQIVETTAFFVALAAAPCKQPAPHLLVGSQLLTSL